MSHDDATTISFVTFDFISINFGCINIPIK